LEEEKQPKIGNSKSRGFYSHVFQVIKKIMTRVGEQNYPDNRTSYPATC